MSGIVGMINLDGSPIDRQLLDQMTAFLAFRGPDAEVTWADGPVGFGHTLLRTTEESEQEHQPCSLDGQVWITADARIDDRATLIDNLAGYGHQVERDVPDVQLILHAYHVWGENCVEHLLGDFAFAIWDERCQSLFCARDHFGVKPFYYARVDGCLVLSNTLNCVRLHPAVSEELNDLAIADFLLIGKNPDPATTVFADIQRLPGAHCLTWSQGGLRLRRYWTLPIDGHIRYRRASDYVERFRELLRISVGDRLRTTRVAVMMSGGIDSTSVAATAKELLSESGLSHGLRAFTLVYDRLIPDRERHYSGLAAKALGIPVHYLALDGYKLYDRWDEPEMCSPEPSHGPLAAGDADFLRELASYSRVALTGVGGDSVFRSSPSYFRNLLKSWRFGQAAAAFGKYLLFHRRLPPLGTGLHIRLKRWRGKVLADPGYPPWLNKELAARLDLPTRWTQLLDGLRHGPPHPLRPEAYQEMVNPNWQLAFEGEDSGVSQFPVEVRYPFFDVRLVNYLLAIPPIPWCADKQLLRIAMRDHLPKIIRLRPKAPLAGFPEFELCRAGDGPRVDDFDPDPRLLQYAARNAIPKVTGDDDCLRVWQNMRPLSLNYWLRYSVRFDKGGMSDGIRSAIHQDQG